MYCDCVLGRAGLQSGYIPVFVISAAFVIAALAVMVGGWRTARFQDLEAVKDQVFAEDDDLDGRHSGG